jgi:hypothetical protein
MVNQDDSSPSVDRDEPTPGDAPSPQRTTPSSWGLFVAGFLLCAAAVGLAFAPFAGPTFGTIANAIARRGALALVVAIGGLLLLGLYDLTRTQRRIADGMNEEEGPEPDEALDGIAGDVALVRGGIQELRVELVYLKDAVRGVQERSGEAGGDGQQDAIFRLAASLDQLGARVEQRLKAQHLDVQDTLLEIHTAVHGIRTQVEQFSGRADHGGEAHETAGSYEPRIEIEADPTHAASGRAGSGPGDEIEWSPDKDVDRHTLGLLDSLDDFGQLLPERTSPSGTAPVNARDGIGLSGADGEPPSALPRILHDRAGDREIPVESKLDHLKSLLADPAVRDALESIRKNV